MKKYINFVFLGDILAPNGAATFFRTIIENRKSLEDSKTSVRFYYRKSLTKYNAKAATKKKYIRSLLQKLSHINSFISFLAFYVFALRNAKRVIRNIGDNKNKNQWVFNDIFSAYYFIKKFPEEKSLYLILHNNGDPTRMIYETHTKLKNSIFEKKIESVAKEIMKKMKKIVLLSPMSKEVLLCKYPNLNLLDKIEIIQNGANIPMKERKKDINNKKYTGISVGSISFRKGFDFLVKANNRLENSNIDIICVGNVQDKDIIKENSKSNIKFVGSRTPDEVAQLLADADFFILCSRDEGMPISIIEAMQYHLPIFATKVGAIPEMIEEGIHGKLFLPIEEEVLDILKKINYSTFDLKKMGMKAYEKYQKTFSTESMLDKYKNLLNEKS